MVPIYRSDGEWVAVFQNGNLFNVDREWIGFVVGRDVYDTSGLYLGYLSNDKRLLRARSQPRKRDRKQPPPHPGRPDMPSNMPLAPMFPALPYQLIDLFEELPDKLSYVSETRADME